MQLACQGNGAHPCPPVSYAAVQTLRSTKEETLPTRSVPMDAGDLCSTLEMVRFKIFELGPPIASDVQPTNHPWTKDKFFFSPARPCPAKQSYGLLTDIKQKQFNF